jgi:hypothetical protein
VLSKLTQPSAATTGTLLGTSARDSITTTKSEHLVQILGLHSFVTQSSEVTISPRPPEVEIDKPVSEVYITSDRAKAQTPPLPDTPKEG